MLLLTGTAAVYLPCASRVAGLQAPLGPIRIDIWVRENSPSERTAVTVTFATKPAETMLAPVYVSRVPSAVVAVKVIVAG